VVAEDRSRGARRVAVTRKRSQVDRSQTDRRHPNASSDRPERTRRIQRGYDSWARLYDWFARTTASIGGVRAGCVRALGLQPGDTVVEFGCGPGVNLPLLCDAVGPTGQVVGVDISGGALARARALVDRHGWENVSLVRADATAPPIQAVDGVLATFVTSLFPDPYAVVGEWCDVSDSVVVAAFAPCGSRPANAALWAFARLNGRLFDLQSGDPLDRLAGRTAEAKRALDDRMTAVQGERYLFGTISMYAGSGEPNRVSPAEHNV